MGKVKSLPWTHSQTNRSADVATASDVQIPRQQCSHIGTSRDGIRSNVGAQLSQGECKGDDKDAESSRAIGSMAVIGVYEKVAQKIKGVPDWFAIDDAGRRRHDDTDERCHGKANGNSDELRPERISRFSGKTSEIGIWMVVKSAMPFASHIPRYGASQEQKLQNSMPCAP